MCLAYRHLHSYDRIDYFYPKGDHKNQNEILFGVQMVTPESKLVVPLDWYPVNSENKSFIVLAV